MMQEGQSEKEIRRGEKRETRAKAVGRREGKRETAAAESSER